MGREVHNATAEYTGLDVEGPPEFEVIQMTTQEPIYVRGNQAIAPIQTQDLDDGVDDETAPWANEFRSSHGSHRYVQSSSSEKTLFAADSPQGSRHSDDTLDDFKLSGLIEPRAPLVRRIAQRAFATLERALVFAAFGMTLSGIVVYTGGCRESYINGCLAHLISM